MADSSEQSDDRNKAIEEYDWLTFKENQDDNYQSSRSQFLKNPLVPIGLIATTFALGNGLRSLLIGDKVLSQRMMRARVSAQGFTIVALVAGLFYHATQE